MKNGGTDRKRLNTTWVRTKRGNRRLRAVWLLLATSGTVGLQTRTVEAANDAWSTNPAGSYFSNASGNDWTTGTTTPGAANGTAGLTDSLYFGTSTTTALDNDDTGAAFTGFTFNSGANAFTISGNAFTLNGSLTNNSTNVQTINDAITVSGTGSLNTLAGSVSLGGAITSTGTVALIGPQAVTFNGSGSSFGTLLLGTSIANVSVNTNASGIGFVGATANLNQSAAIGTVSVGSGANVINVASGQAITGTSAFSNVTTNDRFSALNINLLGTATWGTTAANTNGIIAIGSQFNLLTLNGTDFAQNSGGFLAPAAYTSSTSTTLGNQSQNTTIVGNVAISSSPQTNTLRFGASTGYTVTIASGQTVGLNGTGNAGGAILMSATDGAVTNTITGGSFTGSSNRGLAILNYDTTPGSSLVLNSNFDNYIFSGSGASGTAVVEVAGGGTVSLGGTNFINGTLYLDGSTLIAGSDSNLGAVNNTVSVSAASGTSVTLSSANANTSGLAVGDVLLGQVISVISSSGTGTAVTLSSAYTGTTISSATTVGYVGGGAIDINGGTLEVNGSFVLGETNNTGSATTGLSTTIRNRNIGLGLKGGTIDVTSSNTLTVPGVISSSSGSSATIGELNKTDSGTLTLDGSAANTGLYLNNLGGTTVLANTGSTGGGNYAANVVTISGGTVTFGSPATESNMTQIANNLNINGGTFDLNGGNGIYSTVNYLNGTGGTITNSSTTTNAVLYIGTSGSSFNDTLTIASNMTDGLSKTLAVTYQGTGSRTVTLSGSNSYSGATTINGFTIIAGSTAALSPNSAFTLANTANAAINLNGNNNTIGSLAGGGATGGNIALGAATLTTGNVGTGLTTYAGVISGAGGLTKIGSGTQVLTGASSFLGATNVTGGTLTLNDSTNASVLASTSQISLSSLGKLTLISASSSPTLINANAPWSITDPGNSNSTPLVYLSFSGTGSGNGGAAVENVFSLTIDGVSQTPGLYGVGAANANDDFGGTGEIDVLNSAPEPGILATLSMGGLMLMRRRRKQTATTL